MVARSEGDATDQSLPLRGRIGRRKRPHPPHHPPPPLREWRKQQHFVEGMRIGPEQAIEGGRATIKALPAALQPPSPLRIGRFFPQRPYC